MKRRKFIQSIAAMPALIALPKIVKSQTTNRVNFYGTYTDPSSQQEYAVHLHIYNSATVSEFKKDFLQKEIEFCVGLEGEVRSTKYKVYKEKSEVLRDAANNSYNYKLYLAKNTGDVPLNFGMIQQDKRGDNILEFGFEDYDLGSDGYEPKVYVFSKDGQIKTYLMAKKNNTTSAYDDLDCFLTSACVFHKGLEDTCYELETLRALRENHMRPVPQYNSMLSEYKIIAPAMLQHIYQAENSSEILECIYAQLVLPSIHLIEQNKLDEAVAYYAEFVQLMQKEYLN